MLSFKPEKAIVNFNKYCDIFPETAIEGKWVQAITPTISILKGVEIICSWFIPENIILLKGAGDNDPLIAYNIDTQKSLIIDEKLNKRCSIHLLHEFSLEK